MPWTGIRPFWDRILNPSPTRQTNSQISKVLSLLPNGAMIADLGAGGRKITSDTIAVDFVKSGDTNIVGDIHNIPLKDQSLDCVFCTGTLEHVSFPEVVLKEISRVLKGKGAVYIDVPFMQCYHPDPNDYWRFTIKGLEIICCRNGFVKIETGCNIGSASAASWVLISFFQSFLPGNVIGRAVLLLISHLISLIKYLDKYTLKGSSSILAPSAVYFIGKKETDDRLEG